MRAVLPLFLQARIPSHFQNYGDEDSDKLHPPKLPVNFHLLSNEDKAFRKELHRKRQVHFFYLGATVHLNPHHHHALQFDPHTYQKTLYRIVSSPWEGENTSLQGHLIPVISRWAKFRSREAPAECPIHYSREEVRQCLDRHEKQKEIDHDLQVLRNFVGVNPEGYVDHNGYAEAKQLANNIKAQGVVESETEFERKDLEEKFPLQDHEEID